jgi:hypothetical protein
MPPGAIQSARRRRIEAIESRVKTLAAALHIREDNLNQSLDALSVGSSLKPLWPRPRCAERLLEIVQFHRLAYSPQRKKIAARAKELQAALEEWGRDVGTLGDLTSEFMVTLNQLASDAPLRPGTPGWRTHEGRLLAMMLQVFRDARTRAGFSLKGPMVRFVASMKPLFGAAPPLFTQSAIKSAWNKLPAKGQTKAGVRYKI